MKRIAAIVGVVLLLLLFIVTLILALIDPSASGELLTIAAYATVIIPITIYICMWIYKTFKKDSH